MAKRGRPRKIPIEPDGGIGAAVLEREAPSPQSIYAPTYKGRRWWLLGIKIDEERQQIPFHNGSFGGIPWQHGTQKQIMTKDGWLGLDSHRMRITRELLFAEQVIRAVGEISQKVVRWQPRRYETNDGVVVNRWKADVLSLEHRIKTYDKKKEMHVPAGYRFNPGDNDVPLSSYLVLILRDSLDQKNSGRGRLFEPDMKSLSTMLDLDPSLIPRRMASRAIEQDGGDEVW